MEALLSSLNLGNNGGRYCTVSTDNDQPELYEDDHSRQPQSALERLTDLGTVSRHPCDDDPEEDGDDDPGSSRGSAQGGGFLQRLRQDLSGALAAVERLGRSSNSNHNHHQNQQRLSFSQSHPARSGDHAVHSTEESLVSGCLEGGRLSIPANHSTGGPSATSSSWSPWRGSSDRSVADGGRQEDQNDGFLLSLFDRVTQKHRQSQISEFDKCFPISANDGQWGSGAAWENSELAAPLTKAAKQRESSSRVAKSSSTTRVAKSSTTDDASDVSLIDLAGASATPGRTKDTWKNWEDDAWESLSRK